MGLLCYGGISVNPEGGDKENPGPRMTGEVFIREPRKPRPGRYNPRNGLSRDNLDTSRVSVRPGRIKVAGAGREVSRDT